MRTAVLLSVFMCAAAGPAAAQDDQGMQMPMPANKSGQQEHQAMSMPGPLGIASARDGSGTSWLPDSSPDERLMHHRGRWMLMLHGNAFIEYIKTGTDRGDDQFGSINWLMGMAQRPVAGGPLTLRVMLSAEPATVGHCGYPNLLQSGEFCDGAALHDRQHPHDLFMEVAADYRRAINSSVAFELYGGPAGEPALGPTAFPHRPSAMPNPIAPISHHWLDSTHISYGVITGGVYGRKWKAEASMFNGREPDDQRWDFDFAALDSYSGRFWLLPTPRWALQVSAGHLKEAEFRPTPPQADVNRVTASATYHRIVDGRVWATTIAWGRNGENDTRASHGISDTHTTSAVTLETAADITRMDTVFGRAEVAGKTPTELSLPRTTEQTWTVAKLQAGYTRWLSDSHGLRVSAGGSVGVSIVPETLGTFYGGRVGGEFAVFLAVRPH